MYEIKKKVVKEVFAHLKKNYLILKWSNFFAFISTFNKVLRVFIRLWHHCEYTMHLFLLISFFILSKLKDILKTLTWWYFKTYY